MKRISLTFLLLLSFSLSAQDRYMVFFTDKSSSQFSIDRPQEFLSERAIKRRSKQGIAINTSDLPVSSAYVSALKNAGIDVFYTSKWMNAALVEINEERYEEVLGLSFVNDLEYVAPGTIQSEGNSRASILSESPTQSNLASFQQEMIGIDRMHHFDLQGQGMLVSVFDDGFDNYDQLQAFQHLVEEERILYTYDFVRNQESVDNTFSHGTRVLSIMAGETDRYQGVVPQAQYILSITEAPNEYRIEEYNWLFAAEKADSAGVDVINTSLGYFDFFTDPEMNYLTSDLDGESAVITRAANMAASKGILLVNSAGNTGSNVIAPADSPGVLAIGAVNGNGEIAGFSSRGTAISGRVKPELVAQGVGTLLIGSNGNEFAQNGTSFSAPLVAGLAAGVWQAFPNKTAEEIKEMLIRSGDEFSTPSLSRGYGLPHFERILESEQQDRVLPTNFFNAFPNPTLSDLQLKFESSVFGEEFAIQLISGEGSLLKTTRFVPFGTNDSIIIDVDEAGLYLLRVISGSISRTERIIKY